MQLFNADGSRSEVSGQRRALPGRVDRVARSSVGDAGHGFIDIETDAGVK